ncbi:MAG: hypothetical protein H6700_05560 [Myxococcales bacterium]|nr:hypothetical protein [Myxococcales bacterium]MCB9520166.1 hypothetical protein [Myxococcales bacterium]MCB9531212.1 hypothetical protein [Myxococcales bacterium]
MSHRAPFPRRRLLIAVAACALQVAACDELGLTIDEDAFDDADVSDAGGDAADTTTDTGPEVIQIQARFAREGTDFYRLPWPSDARLTVEGGVDLSDFPDTRVDLLRRYVAAIESSVRGFSLMPVIYVPLEGDPIPETTPMPADSLSPTGPVQLIDVSEDGCGDRIPVELHMNHSVDALFPDNVLAVAPVPGFVLRPATPYALVVLHTLGAEDGYGVVGTDEASAALDGTHADAILSASFAPARACLPEAGVPLDSVAVATVFTTQDPVTELRALRDFVADPAKTATPVVTSFEYSDTVSRAGYAVYTGTYDTPMFQDGTSPYASVGGEIHFDAAGEPIVQRTEEVPFAVAVPREPSRSLRLLIWVDGTGAGQTSWVGSRVTQAMLAEGFVVANYVPQFHDTRATPGANEELHSFNYLNPESFRNTFRQQVADTAYFLRVMTEARDQMPDLPEYSTTRVVYGGQSQGSLVGAMVAGVEPNIEAFMLNGVAAYLSTVAVSRKDPFDIQALVADLTGISHDFDRFHPLMALAQMGGDATDPQSFAPYWTGWDGNPDGADILLINGIDDYTSSVASMNALTISGDAAPVDPAGWEADPFGVWDREPEAAPIEGNRRALDGTPRTIATIMSETTGHFTMYDRADVRATAIEFLSTAADGSAVVE